MRYSVLHSADNRFYQITHILKRTCLGAIAMDSQRLTAKCLHNEVGYHTAILRTHPRPVCIEYANDTCIYTVFFMIVVEQGLGTALPLIITATDTEGIHIAPIRFILRRDLRIAIHFTGGSKQDSCSFLFSKFQKMDAAKDRSLECMYRRFLILHRRSRTGQMVNLMQCPGYRPFVYYIMLKETEMRGA